MLLVTEPLPDTWTPRDFPVLRAAVALIDRGEGAGINALCEATALDLAEVTLALRALRRRGLVGLDLRTAGLVAGVSSVSGEAYLETGLHPTENDLVAQLVTALRKAADEVEDPDEKSRLRKLADGLGGVSRDVLSGVLTTVITAAGRGLIN